MLTEEQIKNLKHGDKLIVDVSFIRVSSDNDLVCSAPVTIGDTVIADNNYFHPSCLTLPPEKPKYDPRRKFKKGDKVRVVEWNGRAPIYLKKHIGTIQVVNYDEDSNGVVCIEGDIESAYVAYLELVTPVEERIPYAIDPANTNRILKYGLKFAEFEDDDAARACCNMLNEKHRKEKEV